MQVLVGDELVRLFQGNLRPLRSPVDLGNLLPKQQQAPGPIDDDGLFTTKVYFDNFDLQTQSWKRIFRYLARADNRLEILPLDLELGSVVEKCWHWF